MPEEFVDLVTAKNAAEAQLICAVLESAGIPARTEGDHLADEWAASQRLLGQIGATVRVPASRLEAARAALDEARRTANDAADQEEAEDVAPSSRSISPYDDALRARSWPGAAVLTTCLLSAVCALFAALWLVTHLQITEMQDDPLFDYRWNEDATELIQSEKDGGRRVSISLDRDGDRIWEEIRTYAPDGRIASQSEDSNENGWFESYRQFTRNGGRAVLQTEDLDGDGFAEKVVIETVDRRRWVFEDRDGDGEYDAQR